MKYLLGLLVLLQVADGLLTHFLIRGGLGTEGNPLLVPLVGENTFLVLKVAGVLLCAFILWDVHRFRPKLAVIATSCFVCIFAGIVLWNASLFFWV